MLFLPASLHRLKDFIRLKDAVSPVTGDFAQHPGVLELFQVVVGGFISDTQLTLMALTVNKEYPYLHFNL